MGDILHAFYLAFAILSFFSVLSFFGLFLYFKELREGPGQLLMCQYVFQAIWDIHWVGYELVAHLMNAKVCQIVGVVGVFAYLGAYNYMLAICLSTSRLLNEKKRNISGKTALIYHLTAIIPSMILAIVIYVQGGTGYSVAYCFVHNESEYRIIPFVVICVYAPTCFLICACFSVKRRREEHFNRYMIITVAVFSLCLFSPVFNSAFYYDSNSAKGYDTRDIAAITGPISGFLTVAIRFTDSTIWRLLKRNRYSSIDTSLNSSE